MDDCVRIDFELPDGYSGDLSGLQDHIETNLLACIPSEVDIKQVGNRMTYAYGSTGMDMGGLEAFFERARIERLEGAVVAVSSDAGEEELFACPDGRIEAFHCREELEEASLPAPPRADRRDDMLETGQAPQPGRKPTGAGDSGAVSVASPAESISRPDVGAPEPCARDHFSAEAENPKEQTGPKYPPSHAAEVSEEAAESCVQEELSFNFGRPGDGNTLLVRLRVTERARQRQILEMFESVEGVRTPARVAAFEAAFAAYEPESGYRPLRWPGFCDAANTWHWGPENMLNGFVFVTRSGPDIYLGFDMQNIHADRASLENFVSMFLPKHFGTEGAWAKYRMVSGKKERLFVQQNGAIVSAVCERQPTSVWELPAESMPAGR